MIIVLLVVVALTIAYLEFLPKIKAIIRFIPSYSTFPGGYEKYISKAPCAKLDSRIIFAYGRLSKRVNKFGKLVRVAILKTRLCEIMKEASYLHVSKITDVGQGLAYYIEISTKGIKPWLEPHSIERIEKEFTEVVNAMFDVRQICAVHRFELDTKEWDVHGCDFVDGISEWDLESVRVAVVNELENGCVDDSCA